MTAQIGGTGRPRRLRTRCRGEAIDHGCTDAFPVPGACARVRDCGLDGIDLDLGKHASVEQAGGDSRPGKDATCRTGHDLIVDVDGHRECRTGLRGLNEIDLVGHFAIVELNPEIAGNVVGYGDV